MAMTKSVHRFTWDEYAWLSKHGLLWALDTKFFQKVQWMDMRIYVSSRTNPFSAIIEVLRPRAFLPVTNTASHPCCAHIIKHDRANTFSFDCR